MLGKGVYTLTEISRLTDLHPSRVRSWFKYRPNVSGLEPIFQSDFESVEGDYAVSFFDLIDVLIAGQFRDHHHVPMRIVRRAYCLLKEELGTQHPFCHSGLYTDGKSIFIDIANELGEERLSEIVTHQQFFVHIKEKLEHIEYSDKNKLAERWAIAKGVIIDPNISFGKPTIVNTGITTNVIARQYFANLENSTLVSDLYGISEKDVINAVKFEKEFGRGKAA